MELDFRKFLMQYGVTFADYEAMNENQQQELLDKFNEDLATANTVTVTDVADAMQGCGTVLFLLPIMGVLLFIIIAIIFA